MGKSKELFPKSGMGFPKYVSLARKLPEKKSKCERKISHLSKSQEEVVDYFFSRAVTSS